MTSTCSGTLSIHTAKHIRVAALRDQYCRSRKENRMDKRKVVMESLRGTACGSLKVVQTLLRTCGLLEDLQEAVNDYLNRSAGCRGGWV